MTWLLAAARWAACLVLTINAAGVGLIACCIFIESRDVAAVSDHVYATRRQLRTMGAVLGLIACSAFVGLWWAL